MSARPWSDADVARLRELVASGASDVLIACDLDRTERSVAIKRSKLGAVKRSLTSTRGAHLLADDTLMRELRRRGYKVTAPRKRKVNTPKTARILGLRTKAERIIVQVARSYGLKRADLLARTDADPISEARRIACYLARKATGLSYREIGLLLDGRHHGTVLAAVRWVEQALARWPGGSTAGAVAQAEEACS